jgi:Tfp pilus assembly protein PilO
MNSRILPLLALMISVGIFFAYIKPTWSGPIADTKTAIAQNDSALKAAKKYNETKNALASEYNSIDQEALARLSTFLPDSVNNVSLILDINALAARSGLSLSSIDVISNSGDSTKNTAPNSTLPVSRADPVGSIDLSLTATGTYNALQEFLVGIEKSARLLDVLDIIVSGSNVGVYTYKMTVRLYWLR